MKKIDSNKVIFFGGTGLLILLIYLKSRQDKKNIKAIKYYYENVKNTN